MTLTFSMHEIYYW